MFLKRGKDYLWLGNTDENLCVKLRQTLVTRWVENAYNRHVSGEGHARARLITFQ